MRRGIVASVAILVAFSIGTVAVEWEEVSWGVDVVLNTETGLPAIVFSASVEYSEFPSSYDLEGGWEIYAVVNGSQVPIEGAPTTSLLRGGTLTIYLSTSQISIEAGKTYGARLSLQDTVNDLSYQRTFTYSPTEVLPIGISLRGWDGSEDVDLSELPDEELEQLVLLHDLLKRYKPSPAEKTAVSFLREDAAAQPDTALLLDGELGVGQEIDRCTYSACGEGCCSSCVEHEETAQEAGAPQQQDGNTDEPSPDVRIECIVYQGTEFETESDEYVQIKNYGTASQDLLGWTLVNQNNTKRAFTFPSSFLLEPEMSIRVYTNEIHDEWGGFSFESDEAIWTNVVQYPVSLVLIPMPPGSISTSGGSITFHFVLTL
ncbi:lamin tail domain-containing protein, partial [Candidatus Bipolaricaulota bacterium]|nr:lamin tail domain-containing protein [Candidatus Bipolaricaulota bacterium]